MKKYLFLLLCFTIVFQACKEDEAIPTPENRLNYDAENFSAPALDGLYEAAVRFNAAEVASFEGKQLTEVEVYFVSVPVAPQIKIYAQGENGIPGPLLYSADITSESSTDSWNTHRLSTALEIPTDGLWISVKIDHPESFGSVGCDQGPADTNGDLLFVYNDNAWTTLRSFTNEETDINWNIRGVVSE